MSGTEAKKAQRSGMLMVLFVAVGLALLSAQWRSTRRPSRAHKQGLLGAPDALLNFVDFNGRIAQVNVNGDLELSRRSQLFTSTLVKVAQHNMWALTRDPTSEPVYFHAQSPANAYLTPAEQHSLRAGANKAMIEMLAGGGGSGHLAADRPVGQAGAELEKKGLGFGRWFKRLTDPGYFEIPNFPLDQQPDPAHVTHIDVDQRACTDSIREQKKCGACYAFSFVALAEWHLCRLTDGKPKDLSEQYIVDCGHKTKLYGCKEGRLSNVRKFSQFFGMKWERDQKYEAREHKCTNDMLNKNTMKVKIVDWKRIKVDREIFEKTLEEQPILLEVHLPNDFVSYSRGVHPGNNCNENMGHGMLLVGYGRQDGVPYWLLRNSMGPEWGENGYARLSRDMPFMASCFANGFVGKFKFESVPEERYTELYDGMKYDPEQVPEEGQKNDLAEWTNG